ncbi:sugar ABC transporter ATP-binding protein [Leifsonia sp. F6_8S_P_1B]|uniref:Sugar ABC transporter ATP-binding protein n=1 Tax=Leifsonia williamsii TaxID=3035919 RepID=A0ABT8K5U5_9MICO|nr:sugar ABC transporter ATP-binding protein [Leifsonia williamsii]MDN4612819.1 sugar ABC transporter ATP-binding protein [Leifsonia williamsii]
MFNDELTPELPGGAAVLELRQVAKSFGAVQALRDGELTLRSGAVHALMGENGAGKSTLVKVIAGVHQPDDGTMSLGGETVVFDSTAQSKSAGIAVVYQEPTLLPDLSVMENIFMGQTPLTRSGNVDRGRMRREARALFARLGVHLDPDRIADGLSIADQQLIEIAKAISINARVLIMDEPTAALSPAEVQRLFTIARSLRDEGCAILFISHRFEEVWDLCDTVTVMRDGAWVATSAIADTSEREVVRQMVGRDVDSLYPRGERRSGKTLLEVRGLTSLGTFHDIDFEVREGEIVGLAGLVGAGRSEVARAVFGVDAYDAGEVTLSGRAVPRLNVGAAIKMGLGLVPEDRRSQGLILEFGLARNAALAVRKALARFGLIRSAREEGVSADWFSKLQVKARALDTRAGTLSGGNQQKIVLAKWLATNPRVLIVDEPTRGIDVGTKAEVHQILADLTRQGVGILMISSDLPEVLGMADRVLVMREGRITAELGHETADAESVMYAATHGTEN